LICTLIVSNRSLLITYLIPGSSAVEPLGIQDLSCSSLIGQSSCHIEVELLVR